MTTVVGVMDHDEWAAHTDILVVVDPSNERLLWVPRDLWCAHLGDRVNTAYKRGGHDVVIAALAEHGIHVNASVCLRRAAVERALAGIRITVPVAKRGEYWYPVPRFHPSGVCRRWELISFEPPEELLCDKRVHEWIGARYALGAGGTDFGRIERQKVLLRRLLDEGFEFAAATTDPDLVSVSAAAAFADLRQVRPTWRFETLDHLVFADIDGKSVLVLELRPVRRSLHGGLRRFRHARRRVLAAYAR